MLKASRYILFTADMKRMAAFYRDALGMKVRPPGKSMGYEEGEFLQLRSGTFEIALHRAGKPGLSGKSRNKLAFFCKDVAAEREKLIARGIKPGPLFGDEKTSLQLCDFKDPDGNTLQLSNR